MIDYSKASAAFDNGLDFLRSLGFIGPIVQTENSRLEGDILVLRFTSEQTGMSVEISYVSAQNGRPSAIAALILTDDGRRFSVSDWLTVNGMAGAIQFSTIEAPNLTEEAFIEQFCQAFEMIVRHYLINVLAGRVWEEVPIDWKGYR